MNIISIIPARGGSKGIPLKNLKILCGKPLLDYSINASLKSKFIKRTFVSSDHSKILNRAQKLGAEIITRPRNISTDKSTTESSIKHCLNYLKSKENYTPDVIVLLQNTSPLRNVKHIDGAIRFFLKSHLTFEIKKLVQSFGWPAQRSRRVNWVPDTNDATLFTRLGTKLWRIF